MAGFMELQVWQEDGADFYDPTEGIDIFMPVSYAEGFNRTGTPRASWWAEYTAPGYLDRTDPVCGDTACEAARECFRLYGNDDDPAERSELAAVLWKCRKLDRREGK